MSDSTLAESRPYDGTPPTRNGGGNGSVSIAHAKWAIASLMAVIVTYYAAQTTMADRVAAIERHVAQIEQRENDHFDRIEAQLTDLRNLDESSLRDLKAEIRASRGGR